MVGMIKASRIFLSKNMPCAHPLHSVLVVVKQTPPALGNPASFYFIGKSDTFTLHSSNVFPTKKIERRSIEDDSSILQRPFFKGIL